jgi:hypothetical protein
VPVGGLGPPERGATTKHNPPPAPQAMALFLLGCLAPAEVGPTAKHSQSIAPQIAATKSSVVR